MKRTIESGLWGAWDFVRPIVVIVVVIGGLALAGAAGLTTGWLVAIGLLWLLPILVGIRMARSKERDGPVVLAVLLGWVGVLFALGLSPAGRRCPRCDEMVRRSASVCRFCGGDLE